MTPEERAENIREKVGDHFENHSLDCDCISFIAAQIREMVYENEAYKKGRASMREEAAKVAEMWPGDGGFIAVNDPLNSIDCMNSLRRGIVKSIRAITVEGSK